MEKIELPESKVPMDAVDEEKDNDFNIQSLLHAVSNKDKVRTDIDDVQFMKTLSRSRSKSRSKPKDQTPPKSNMNPLNIFNHLKNLSDRVEKEDEKKEKRSSSPRPTPKSPPRKKSPAKSYRSNNSNKSVKHTNEDKALLLQTYYLLQQQGVKSELKLDIGSDFRILQAEVTRMKTELNSQKMIKFMRKGLIAFVSGMEFLNTRYDPVGLKLNGYSEHVMTSLGDYDGVFLRLYDKYKDRTQALSPEVELLMLLLGSMMMFHLTQSFVQQTIPQFNRKKKDEKPPMSDSDDDDDIESVTTDVYRPNQTPPSFKIPTEILSTPAFPALVQKMVSSRPKLQSPKKKLDSIPEVKEIDIDKNPIKAKNENVLVIS